MGLNKKAKPERPIWQLKLPRLENNATRATEAAGSYFLFQWHPTRYSNFKEPSRNAYSTFFSILSVQINREFLFLVHRTTSLTEIINWNSEQKLGKSIDRIDLIQIERRNGGFGGTEFSRRRRRSWNAVVVGVFSEASSETETPRWGDAAEIAHNRRAHRGQARTSSSSPEGRSFVSDRLCCVENRISLNWIGFLRSNFGNRFAEAVRAALE